MTSRRKSKLNATRWTDCRCAFNPTFPLLLSRACTVLALTRDRCKLVASAPYHTLLRGKDFCTLQSLDIIVYGDSLPAYLRGPAGGVRDGTGVPEVWVKHHGHRRTKNMAESSNLSCLMLLQ